MSAGNLDRWLLLDEANGSEAEEMSVSVEQCERGTVFMLSERSSLFVRSCLALVSVWCLERMSFTPQKESVLFNCSSIAFQWFLRVESLLRELVRFKTLQRRFSVTLDCASSPVT